MVRTFYQRKCTPKFSAVTTAGTHGRRVDTRQQDAAQKRVCIDASHTSRLTNIYDPFDYIKNISCNLKSSRALIHWQKRPSPFYYPKVFPLDGMQYAANDVNCPCTLLVEFDGMREFCSLASTISKRKSSKNKLRQCQEACCNIEFGMQTALARSNPRLVVLQLQ